MASKIKLNDRNQEPSLESHFEWTREKLYDYAASVSRSLSSETMCDPFIETIPENRTQGLTVTIDFGGTKVLFSLTQVHVKMVGRPRRIDVLATEHVIIPDEVRAQADGMFRWLAKETYKFLAPLSQKLPEIVPIGFTFSFPLRQNGLASGTLLRLTKGFVGEKLIGQDVVALFQNELNASHNNNVLSGKKMMVKVVALVNDVVSVLYYSLDEHPSTILGVVIGTGFNFGLVDRHGKLWNTEVGRFASETEPPARRWTNRYDEVMFSKDPGGYRFERHISGRYVGEMFRIVLIEQMRKRKIGANLDATNLVEEYSISGGEVATISWDDHNFSKTKQFFSTRFDFNGLSNEDCDQISSIGRLILGRAAKSAAAVMAAGIVYSGRGQIGQLLDATTEPVNISIDGGFFLGNAEFAKTIIESLEIFFPNSKQMVIVRATPDSSSKGAALLAVSTLELYQRT